MASIKNYNRSHLCPICGKPDYCGYFTGKNGYTYHLEMRPEFGADCIKAGDVCYGQDGQRYVFLKVTGEDGRGANRLFVSESDYLEMQVERQRGYEQWCREHGFKPKKDKYVATPVDFGDTQERPSAPVYSEPVELDKVEPLPPSVLDRVFRSMAKHLILEDRHREYLRKEGWTDEMIELYMVRSFPEKDSTRFKFRKDESRNSWRKSLAKAIMADTGLQSLKGVPGAYRTEKGDWTFLGNSGLVFFVPDIYGRFIRARIRLDFRDAGTAFRRDAEGEYYLEGETKVYMSMKGLYTVNAGRREYRKAGGKYRNLSSYFEDEKLAKEGYIKNVYTDGCRSGNVLGFYLGKSTDVKYGQVLITEGEKKAAFSAYGLRQPVIAVPGVDSWPLMFKADDTGKSPCQILKERGCKVIIVAYDADKATNASVLTRQAQTAEALEKEGFLIGIAEWDIEEGKGLDDLLAGGGGPDYVLWREYGERE